MTNLYNTEKMYNNIYDRGNPRALIPIAVFLMTFLGSGIITKDFYTMPAIVSFLIALVVAFMQNKGLSFNEKVSVIAKGVGDENIITMILIFLCAGGFSGAVTVAGGVESTVNLWLSIFPLKVAVPGLFVIGCFISFSMGTSMGTIAALAPVAIGISEKTGIAMSVCIGAVMCGAMFGDNLSMISDTTIAAVKTQGCEMKDKFKENFKIVLPAAVFTILIFFIKTGDSDYMFNEALSYNLFRIVPYILVLVGAVIGINVFIVLIGGTICSILAGFFTGSITLNQVFIAIGGGNFNGQNIGGVSGMYDIAIISIIVACIVSLVKEYGGIQFILYVIRRRIKGKKGAELGIAGLSFLVDACTANNTVAIVMAGPIAKEIVAEFDVSPKRSASLLDIYSSVAQGMIPYGAQLLSAATLTGITPFDIMPYLYYPMLMAVSGVMFILLRKRE